MPDLRETVERLDKLHKEATPGPWKYEAGGGHAYNRIVGSKCVHYRGRFVGENSYSDRVCENLGAPEHAEAPRANVKFICDVFNAWPQLSAALQRLREIEAATKADADDLAKMRDGTKMTRAGLVDMIVYQRQEIAALQARQGWVMVPAEPTTEMIRAAIAHSWSGGYDRNGSHASGQYEDYRINLPDAYTTSGAMVAAEEVYKAMIAAAEKP